jgi:hypothetical protein
MPTSTMCMGRFLVTRKQAVPCASLTHLQAFYDLLNELQEADISVVRQDRKVREADAYIARMCREDQTKVRTTP